MVQPGSEERELFNLLVGDIKYTSAIIPTIVFLFLFGTSKADPVSITWFNQADIIYPPVTKALLCVNEFCSMDSLICMPQETCTSFHNLPPGTWPEAELMVSAREFGYVWSPPVMSPTPLVVEPLTVDGVCFHDSNGDGTVSTADFGTFFSEFRHGCD